MAAVLQSSVEEQYLLCLLDAHRQQYTYSTYLMGTGLPPANSTHLANPAATYDLHPQTAC
jgi:hypothetical protein